MSKPKEGHLWVDKDELVQRMLDAMAACPEDIDPRIGMGFVADAAFGYFVECMSAEGSGLVNVEVVKHEDEALN